MPPIRGVTRAPGSFFAQMGAADPNAALGFSYRATTPAGSLSFGGGKPVIVRSRYLGGSPRHHMENPPRVPSRMGSPRSLVATPRQTLTPLRPMSKASPRNSTPRQRDSHEQPGGVVKRAFDLDMKRSAKHMEVLDRNSDGLDPIEFKEFLRAQLEGTKELDELNAVEDTTFNLWFECLDKGKDGRVSKADLFGFMLNQATMATGHRNITSLLKSFPELTRGTINVTKLESFVLQIGFDVSTAQEIMSEMDQDGSGSVNFGELEVWSKRTMKNGDVKLFDGGQMWRPLDKLSEMLQRGRVRRGKSRKKEKEKRKEAFAELASQHPEIAQVQRKLGNVMPTPDHVSEAEQLGQTLRRKVDDVVKAVSGPSNLIDLIESWDLNGNGALGLREFHQAIVLIGIADCSAEAVQVLFDEIDVNASYTLTFEELVRYFGGEEPSE